MTAGEGSHPAGETGPQTLPMRSPESEGIGGRQDRFNRGQGRVVWAPTP